MKTTIAAPVVVDGIRYGTAALLVLLAAVWGLSFVAARAALPYIPPVPLAALRDQLRQLWRRFWQRLTARTTWLALGLMTLITGFVVVL